jgi:hypothetical protein
MRIRSIAVSGWGSRKGVVCWRQFVNSTISTPEAEQLCGLRERLIIILKERTLVSFGKAEKASVAVRNH